MKDDKPPDAAKSCATCAEKCECGDESFTCRMCTFFQNWKMKETPHE